MTRCIKTVLLYAAAAAVMLVTHLVAWPLLALAWLWYDATPASGVHAAPEPDLDPDLDYAHTYDPNL